MARRKVHVEVLAGTFDTQQHVFAHLLDHVLQQGLTLDMDQVDVITKVDPERRLAHVFPEAIVNQVVDALGIDTTVVLVFEGASEEALGASGALRLLGTWPGSRLVPEV